MSPRFYGFLWIAFLVPAAVLWLAGSFTMMAAVAFGFTAFGMTFVGMMCVLPSMVSHPVPAKAKPQPAVVANKQQARTSSAAKALTYRSV